MLIDHFEVSSPNVKYTADYIESSYNYQDTKLYKNAEKNTWLVEPIERGFVFRTHRKVPKLGIMLIGWGGNNGSTLTAGLIANRKNMKWETKDGFHSPNYWGSLTQSSTCQIGKLNGQDYHVPFKNILPMVEPNDLQIDGWDISSLSLEKCVQRARVLDLDLQQQLVPYLKDLRPRPSIFDPGFVAANQKERADNIIEGEKQNQMEQIRADIRDFKEKSGVEKVVVMWTANTERYCKVEVGIHDTEKNLRAAIRAGNPEISPSTLYALACLDEDVPFINGSPQNTFVPGVLEAACRLRVLIGGDDFKTGQTKMKSVLVDFLIGAGIKPLSIASYNHLGNNDGKNLMEPGVFRSKEISKSNVVDDIVASNRILYREGESPNHVVVIKYVPSVDDSKRAMDEYVSEIFMNGRNTISMHNTCEDSLLAAPLILDLCLITELLSRIELKYDDEESFRNFHPCAALLSYLTKSPLVPPGMSVTNALYKQRAMLENVFRAVVGLAPVSHMNLDLLIEQSNQAIYSPK